jgi:hypothetical protein
MRVMRAAWSGLLLHSPHELVRGGMSAFKANWKEERLHRRLMTAAVGGWLDLVDRNKAVAAVRKRIIQVGARTLVASICIWRSWHAAVWHVHNVHMACLHHCLSTPRSAAHKGMPYSSAGGFMHQLPAL